MPETTEHAPGTPCWTDLTTPDLPKSVDFYKNVFGWDAADMGEDMGHYTIFSQGGKSVAAATPPMGPPGHPPVWTTYISVSDADKVSAQAAEAGATVQMAPMDVPGQGRMAIITDPTGATFGLWQPNGMNGAQLVREPNSLSWVELASRDTDAASKFYEALGWTYEVQDIPGNNSGGKYTVFSNNGEQVGGLMSMENYPPEVPSYWGVYFEVADTDATVEKIKANGGSLLMEPMDIPTVGRFAAATDNVGAVFSVITSETPAS